MGRKRRNDKGCLDVVAASARHLHGPAQSRRSIGLASAPDSQGPIPSIGFIDFSLFHLCSTTI